jgi:hypothetical protein
VSNLLINIRIIFWHLQLTTELKWSWSFNKYQYRIRAVIIPLAIYELRFLELVGLK